MIITLIPFLFAIGGAGHPFCGALCLKREGYLVAHHPSPLAWGPAWYSCYPCLVFVLVLWEILFQIRLWPNANQLMPNIWAWNSFKQCPAEKPACFSSTVWVVTFTEATTKLFVKCMLCCIWQHEWEAARSDQGWTSHLTSKMKGKIGHYRRCIQTTKHNSALA